MKLLRTVPGNYVLDGLEHGATMLPQLTLEDVVAEVLKAVAELSNGGFDLTPANVIAEWENPISGMTGENGQPFSLSAFEQARHDEAFAEEMALRAAAEAAAVEAAEAEGMAVEVRAEGHATPPPEDAAEAAEEGVSSPTVKAPTKVASKPRKTVAKKATPTKENDDG